MRHHTVAEELLTQAVKALRELAELKAPKLSSGLRQNTEEWRTADEFEAIMKHPGAKPNVAKTHRPAHNI